MNQNRTLHSQQAPELPVFSKVIVYLSDTSANDDVFTYVTCEAIPCAAGIMYVVQETQGEQRRIIYGDPTAVRKVETFPRSRVSI